MLLRYAEGEGYEGDSDGEERYKALQALRMLVEALPAPALLAMPLALGSALALKRCWHKAAVLLRKARRLIRRRNSHATPAGCHCIRYNKPLI